MEKLSLNEVAKHNHISSCWIVIHAKVYDVTAFIKDHPGGREILMDVAGQDGSDLFEEIGRHSVSAREMMDQYCIGYIDSEKVTE